MRSKSLGSGWGVDADVGGSTGVEACGLREPEVCLEPETAAMLNGRPLNLYNWSPSSRDGGVSKGRVWRSDGEIVMG